MHLNCEGTMLRCYGHLTFHILPQPDDHQPSSICHLVVECHSKPIRWSPRELIFCHKLDIIKHCRVPFGAYCEVHKEPQPSNSVSMDMTCYCFGVLWKYSRVIQIFCLTTRRKITCRSFTKLAMPDSIIDQVNQIGKQECDIKGLVFQNRQRSP